MCYGYCMTRDTMVSICRIHITTGVAGVTVSMRADRMYIKTMASEGVLLGYTRNTNIHLTKHIFKQSLPLNYIYNI